MDNYTRKYRFDLARNLFNDLNSRSYSEEDLKNKIDLSDRADAIRLECEAYNVSVTTVKNWLRIFTLHENVIRAIAENKISFRQTFEFFDRAKPIPETKQLKRLVALCK